MAHESQTRFLDINVGNDPICLREGGALNRVRIGYQTWGNLNADKSNAILLFHALSGSQHAAGENRQIDGVGDLWQPELHQGWWEEMVGPGKALDTDRYFIVCGNYLGGCYGTTGPASVCSETGKPWGSSFPAVSASDQAELMARLIASLEIDQLHAVVGPSIGGLIALTYATRFPEQVRNVISIASGCKTTVLNRLILFEQILAIENDPHFQGGDYYDGEPPRYGLALARMISHKTFVHLDSIERRARRDVVQAGDALAWYRVRDQFQSYMLHQGKKFVNRFDANTYLRLIDMWSRFDAVVEGDAESPLDLFKRACDAGQRWLVFSIDSDFCFYPEEQEELVGQMHAADVDAMHITVHSEKGHDSFLLEPLLYTPHIKWLLGDHTTRGKTSL